MHEIRQQIHHIELSQEDRFLEIRDLFVCALRRILKSEKTMQSADNELDKDSDVSVYARHD
ncbi:MAG: hypothetical protein JW739_08120 [Opitutales bacterium]|nr:hypothetical protein [Opitutales bacterium]